MADELSLITLGAARSYTNSVVEGMGAIKGAPCQIQGITAITGGHRVTFLWVDNSDVSHTSTMDVLDGSKGDTGLGIKGVTVNSSNHLIVTYDDDTTADAGEIKDVSTSFDKITDVDLSNLEDGQILKYNSTTQKWENASGGSVSTNLGDLNDVNIESLSDGQIIKWDATNGRWVNADNSPAITIDPAPTSESTNAVSSGGTYTALSGKADKSEMSVVDGTGADADKTTITLKTGTAATVLKSHQSITGKADKVSSPTDGNFAGLDANGNLTDSGKKASDFVEWSQAEGSVKKNILKNNATTQTINGVTFTVNADKSVSVCGTATADASLTLHSATDGNIPAKSYIVSGCPSEGSSTTYGLYTAFKNADDTGSWVYSNDFGETGHPILTGADKKFTATIIVKNGSDMGTSESPKVFYPMIRLASIADSTYVPYILDNKELASSIGSKADKVVSATNGHFAGLDANGNLTDSGKKAADFGKQAELNRVFNDYGAKNLLKVTAQTRTVGDLTFTVYSDGRINVSGTQPTEDYEFSIGSYSYDSERHGITTDYWLSGGIDENVFLRVWISGSAYYNRDDTGSGVKFDLSRTNDSASFAIGIKGAGEETPLTINETLYPMFRYNDVSNAAWRPYAMTNAELTSAISNKADKSAATTNNLGLVKPDGTTITVDNDGTIHGTSTLAGLTDTTITNPSNGQVLSYDSTNSKWVNESLPEPDGMAKTRYAVSSGNWSASQNASGYYTYTISLGKSVNASYSPNVYLAGSGDNIFPTDTERNMYKLLNEASLTSATTVVLYAKTKPTSTFYVFVEIVSAGGAGGAVRANPYNGATLLFEKEIAKSDLSNLVGNKTLTSAEALALLNSNTVIFEVYYKGDNGYYGVVGVQICDLRFMKSKNGNFVQIRGMFYYASSGSAFNAYVQTNGSSGEVTMQVDSTFYGNMTSSVKMCCRVLKID